MKVVELFAGVGGFRLAAQKSKKKFDFIWSNQWEPKIKNQFAFNCYQRNFGISENHNNEDITKAKYNIPNNFDLLVAGFPCQDYSVATTKAKGIQGIKGVLWWEIYWVLENKRPKLVLLENVDRLLKSPSNQRGRDFAIMLMCFDLLGYDVEWMVNNGADFGYAQKRRRVFIYAYLREEKNRNIDIFLKAFDFQQKGEKKELNIHKYKNIKNISKKFNEGKFLNYGTCHNGLISMYDFISYYSGQNVYLKDILEKNISFKEFFLNKDQLSKMKYLKGSKKIIRINKNGFKYHYTEGKISLFDDINKKSRTMLTSEGTINRSTHVIKVGSKYRFITPIEAERLNGFSDNWTKGMTNRQRYFCMGNALNVDLVAEIFKQINNK